MSRLPQTERETLQASVETMERQLECQNMRYAIPAVRGTLGLLVLFARRVLNLYADVDDLERRLNRLDGRNKRVDDEAGEVEG
jgi:hypothetical protein